MLDKEIKRIEKEIEELSRLATLIPIRKTFKTQTKIVALKKELKLLTGAELQRTENEQNG